MVLTTLYRGYTADLLLSKLSDAVREKATVQKFAQIVAHFVVNPIPRYDMEVGQSYTIEQCCLHVNKIIKFSYNKIFHAIFNIAASVGDVQEQLLIILSNTAYGEVMSACDAPILETYKAFLLYYNPAFTILIDDSMSWVQLQRIFLEEVSKYES